MTGKMPSLQLNFSVCLTVTLDYKSLLLLTLKKDNADFKLGGKGYDCEFCLFCTAIRVIIKNIFFANMSQHCISTYTGISN